MSNRAIPADFPRGKPLASLPGFQPKVAVGLVDGQYITGLTDEEWLERYDICEDLAQQFAAYCTRKAAENPDWNHEFNLARARKGLAQQVPRGVWDFSATEQDWVMKRAQQTLGW